MAVLRCACCFCYVALVLAQKGWPLPYEPTPDNLPIIEIGLEPPPLLLPEASAVVGDLDASREGAEAALMQTTVVSYQGALSAARQRVGVIVGRCMRLFEDRAALQRLSGARRSFAAFGTPKRGVSLASVGQAAAGRRKFSVDVSVVGGEALPAGFKTMARALETRQSEDEKRSAGEASASFQVLADVLLAAFEAELREQIETKFGAGGAFATSLAEAGGVPQQANVRVSPSGAAYPSAYSMVDAMEARRRASENLIFAKIGQLQLQFVKDVDAMVADGLETAIRKVLSRWAEPLS